MMPPDRLPSSVRYPLPGVVRFICEAPVFTSAPFPLNTAGVFTLEDVSTMSCEPVPSIVISVTSSKFAMSESPTVTVTLSPLITTVSPAAEGFAPFCHPDVLPQLPDAPAQTHSAADSGLTARNAAAAAEATPMILLFCIGTLLLEKETAHNISQCMFFLSSFFVKILTVNDIIVAGGLLAAAVPRAERGGGSGGPSRCAATFPTEGGPKVT